MQNYCLSAGETLTCRFNEGDDIAKEYIQFEFDDPENASIVWKDWKCVITPVTTLRNLGIKVTQFRELGNLP